MAIKKAFVIKDGLEVNSDVLIVNGQNKNVGIGSTIPRAKLDVSGGFIATDSYVTGISTVINKLNVGSNGSVFTVLGVGGSVGIGTALPGYLLDIRSPVSTGQTALYVKGDVNITGSIVSSNTSSFSGYASTAGIATYAIISGVSTSVSGGIASVTQLNVSGISTFGNIVELNSSLKDFYDQVGISGSILVSTGAGVSWTTPFAAGIQGLQGTQGTTGTGTQGTQGTTGTGTQGTQGTTGAGTQGTQGTTGAGTQGTQGTQGTTGTGTQGTQGTQGTTGGGGSITDDTSTNSTLYPLFQSATSGTLSGVNVSSTNLQFNPLTGTLSATVFTSLSDKTQKTNIRPIDNSIELVKQLEGVRYDWINNQKPSIGVIAQDIEKVLPEVVEMNTNGLKSVSYGNIVGVLIEAIKEQQVRIEELERKLNA